MPCCRWGTFALILYLVSWCCVDTLVSMCQSCLAPLLCALLSFSLPLCLSCSTRALSQNQGRAPGRFRLTSLRPYNQRRKSSSKPPTAKNSPGMGFDWPGQRLGALWGHCDDSPSRPCAWKSHFREEGRARQGTQGSTSPARVLFPVEEKRATLWGRGRDGSVLPSTNQSAHCIWHYVAICLLSYWKKS